MYVGDEHIRFCWTIEETKSSFDVSFQRKYTEIMAGAITFIMEIGSYSQIYYDYITRTIHDLLFHSSQKTVLQMTCCWLHIAKNLTQFSGLHCSQLTLQINHDSTAGYCNYYSSLILPNRRP